MCISNSYPMSSETSFVAKIYENLIRRETLPIFDLFFTVSLAKSVDWDTYIRGRLLRIDNKSLSRSLTSDGVSAGPSLFPNPIAVEMYSGLKPRISLSFVRCLKKWGYLLPLVAVATTKDPATNTNAIANAIRMVFWSKKRDTTNAIMNVHSI